MDKMKAYVFKDVGKLVFEEKPIPHVKDPDDVLLKVKAVGICGSDLKIIEGKHHFRPEHRSRARVLRRGDRDRLACHTTSSSVTGWRSTTISAADFAPSAAWDSPASAWRSRPAPWA